MPVESQIEQGLVHRPVLMVQALVVTAGPFAGRICENDDDEFLLKSDFQSWEIQWFEDAGVIWRNEELDGDSSAAVESNSDPRIGVNCEIVTFGFYLSCRGHYFIPHQFLRPATTRDLVQRLQQIEHEVFQDAWDVVQISQRDDVVDLLKEENYIVHELWRREKVALDVKVPRNVFLCHSSDDKWFVREVWSDLLNAGHKPWLDEYEIKVGDSIVQKIDEGTREAGALVLFLSKSSIQSSWVLREWSSALARQLSKRNIQVLPALVEDCEIPSILSDVKYADFRGSYNAGLAELMNGLK
jgi:hypothetical protein